MFYLPLQGHVASSYTADILNRLLAMPLAEPGAARGMMQGGTGVASVSAGSGSGYLPSRVGVSDGNQQPCFECGQTGICLRVSEMEQCDAVFD